MTCSVDGCSGIVQARGWCQKHYMRWSRHGDPLKMLPKGGRIAGDPVARFHAKVNAAGPIPPDAPELGPCALWEGTLTSGGYGTFSLGRERNVSTHVYAYELALGPVPSGHHVHHRCHNRQCVRLEHLAAMTPTEHRRQHLKTHCKRGHEFAPENTLVSCEGYRECRACRDATRRRRVEARLS